MKISEETLNILRNFSQINPSIYIKDKTSLTTMSPSKSVAAVASCKESFDMPFAVYDLSRFLGTVSLFKDPDLDFQENVVYITEGKTSVAYRYTSPEMLIYPKKKMKNQESLVTFNFSEDNLTSIMKASAILGTPEIAIYGKDGVISVKALDSKDLSSDEFSLVIGETEETFEVYIRTENLKFILSDYEVSVSKVATQFKSDVATYWVANEFSSKV